MTDRVSSITIVLEEDVRIDGIEPLLSAIKQFRGVLDAKANVKNHSEWMAETRVRYDLNKKLLEVINLKQ